MYTLPNIRYTVTGENFSEFYEVIVMSKFRGGGGGGGAGGPGADLKRWCAKMTEGYPGVTIANFHTSWRDGLGMWLY